MIMVSLAGYDPAEVLDVKTESSAEKAGLQTGDVITEYEGYTIDLSRDLYLYTYFNPAQEDKTVHMTVDRDGQEINLAFKPDVSVRYLLGFNRSDASSMEVESLIQGMPLGVKPVFAQAGRCDHGHQRGRRSQTEKHADAYLEEHPLSDEPVQITYERDGLEYDGHHHAAGNTVHRSLGFSYNARLSRRPKWTGLC